MPEDESSGSVLGAERRQMRWNGQRILYEKFLESQVSSTFKADMLAIVCAGLSCSIKKPGFLRRNGAGGWKGAGCTVCLRDDLRRMNCILVFEFFQAPRYFGVVVDPLAKIQISSRSSSVKNITSKLKLCIEDYYGKKIFIATHFLINMF